MKGSVDTTMLLAAGHGVLRRPCAVGHWPWLMLVPATRWPSRPTSGTSDTFDGAIADFAETYADVNERDHAAYVAAIADGRVSMPPAAEGEQA